MTKTNNDSGSELDEILDSFGAYAVLTVADKIGMKKKYLSLINHKESDTLSLDQAKAKLQAHIDRKVLEAEKRHKESLKTQIMVTKSYCGCPMCEHHTSAYALNHHQEESQE